MLSIIDSRVRHEPRNPHSPHLLPNRPIRPNEQSSLALEHYWPDEVVNKRTWLRMLTGNKEALVRTGLRWLRAIFLLCLWANIGSRVAPDHCPEVSPVLVLAPNLTPHPD